MSRASRWQRGILVLAVLLVLPARHCHGGQVLQARVEYRHGHYLLHLDMRIHAKYADVYRTLLDFQQLPQINDSIKSAQELWHRGRVHRVRIVAKGCIWIFCRTIKQAVTLTELDNGYLRSVTDPQHSDLHYGFTMWHIIDEGKTTRVTYNADFVPAFWVPPLIGPVILKHQFLREGQKTINGIERLLRKRAPPAPG